MRPENKEYISLVKAAGWTPAEAARRLDLARSSTGRFLTGEIAPSSQVLKLVKLILAAEQPGTLGAAPARPGEPPAEWEREVIGALRGLRVNDRTRIINAMRAMTTGLPRREPAAYAKASSAPDSGAARLLKKVSAGVHKRGGGRTS